MEALVLIVGEMFAVLAWPFVVLFVDLIGAIIGGVFCVSQSKRAAKSRFGAWFAGLSEARKKRFRRIARWSLGLTLTTTAALISGMIVVDRTQLPAMTQWSLAQVEKRTSFKVTFDQVTGSVIAGNLQLQGVRVTKSNEVDLHVDTIEVKWGLLDLLYGDVDVSRLNLDGLHGRIVKSPSDRKRIRPPKKAFVVENFSIQNVEVVFIDDEGAMKVTASLQAKPLHSRRPLWTILFRSNGFVTFDGRRLEVETKKLSHAMQTSWSARNLPVSFVSKWIKIPFSLFDQGTLDIDVRDRWTHQDYWDVNLNISLQVNDGHIVLPEDTSFFDLVPLKPAVSYLNTQNPIELTFSLVMNPDAFELDASDNMNVLWNALGVSMVSAVIEQAGTEKEPEEMWQKVKGVAVDVLDKKRKKKN